MNRNKEPKILSNGGLVLTRSRIGQFPLRKDDEIVHFPKDINHLKKWKLPGPLRKI